MLKRHLDSSVQAFPPPAFLDMTFPAALLPGRVQGLMHPVSACCVWICCGLTLAKARHP